MRKLRLSFLMLFLPVVIMAQPHFPPNGELFSTGEIPSIYITIDTDSLDELYLEENWYENHEYPALFVFENSTGADTLQDIGLRFRGNTSRDKIKKSFKVSFNTFIPGRKFHGVEKLNLNAEVNDPSMLRSRLCWDLYREMKIPASRSNHIKLYINGDYYGLYQNIEHYDDEFIATWFGNNAGNLYKCRYPANLDFISNNPNDYKESPFGDRTYELKTNDELDDYSDLAEFIAFLNQALDEGLVCRLPEYFNVITYLKTAAIDVLTGNWDGYIYNQNNFYLYHNPLTSQFEYLPYDVDNTWGIDFLNRDWSDREIYNWSQGGADRPLFNRLMDQPKYRDIFSWYLKYILDNIYNTPDYQQSVESLQGFIEDAALTDPYRPLDYGWSEQDFIQALDQSAGQHVDYGILPFAEIRRTSSYGQLETVSIAPFATHIREDFSGAPDLITFKIEYEGPALSDADLNYQIDGAFEQTITASPDSAGYLQFQLNLAENVETLSYNIDLNSDNGNNRSIYCQDRQLVLNASDVGVVINEIMSSNATTISDGAGEFEDWIELFNSGNNAVNLSDYRLSDNVDAPIKWALPYVTLDPGDFLLIWADDDTEQWALHTNFNVNLAGENIYLFREDDNGLTLADHINLPALPTDYSYGRQTDGGEPWVLFSQTTPNASNDGSISGLKSAQDKLIMPHPNPATENVFLGAMGHYRLTDLNGRVLKQGRGNKVNISSFVPGTYLLRVNNVVFKIVGQ